MTALRDFVAELMEREGAAVEALAPDGLAVMAPPRVRAALGWPELARLGFGPDSPAGAQRIGVEGGWLERFDALIADRGRHAERQIDCDPPPVLSDPERLLERVLDLPNAVWRFRSQRPAWTRLLLIAFRMTAVSDEKRENNLWLGFNVGTGAALGGETLRLLRASLDGQAWRAPDPAAREAAGAGWDAATLAARVRPALDATVEAELAPFLRSMQRRLARDHARLHGYHDDLRRESLTRLAALAGLEAPKAENDRQRERQRIAAIEREYRVKLGDLRHKYALRVTLEWIQTLELVVPVQRLEVLIRRRKGERVIHLDWRPLVRSAEPPLCEWGQGLNATRLVCDERLHLTEPAGQDPCAGCGKPFCRACHPTQCPRCGRAVKSDPATAAGA
ncbi:MAG: hypothetical protein JO288_21175 [Hyphomicrobiales bacterium]|nr:hypothetical protein [Hyphomicrobiales bacterium]